MTHLSRATRNEREDGREPPANAEEELGALLREPTKKAALLSSLEDNLGRSSGESASHSTPTGKSMGGWAHCSHFTPCAWDVVSR